MPPPLGRWRDRLVTLLVAATLLLRFSQTAADADLWGHVRFGLDLWETKQVVRADTYSYTSGDTPWINHEWLAEALFGGVYRLSGAAGLIGLKVVVTLLTLGGAYAHLRSRGLSDLTGSITLLALSFLLSPGLVNVRPHLFTYLCFLALLVCLSTAERGRVKWLWALPPLFAAWANLHGGFLAGLGILWVWAALRLAGACVQCRSLKCLTAPPQPAILMSVVVSSLAVLLNPYGYRLLVFLLRTATVPRPEISEWLPLEIQSPLGLTYLAVLAASAAALAFTRRRRSPSLLILFGLTALLPVTAVRHLPLFALSVLVIAGEHLGDAWARLPTGRARRPTGKGNRLAVLILLALFAGSGILAAASIRRFKCIQVDRAFYPVDAVAVLGAAGVSGKMAVHFNWGEYVLWHLAPAVRVSVDGRRETVYPADVYAANHSFVYGYGEWDAVLRDYPTDLALVGSRQPARNLLALDPEWDIAYEDGVGAIAVRRGSPLLSQIVSVGAQAWTGEVQACFP